MTTSEPAPAPPAPADNPYTGRVDVDQIVDPEVLADPDRAAARIADERGFAQRYEEKLRDDPDDKEARDGAMFHHAAADAMERRAAGEPEPVASTYPTTPLTDEERAHAAGMVAVIADPDDGAMRAIPVGTPAWLAAAEATCMYQRRADGDDPSEEEWRAAQDRAEEHVEDIGAYENDTQEEKERVMATQAVACAVDAGMNRGDEETVKECTDVAIEWVEDAVGYGVQGKFNQEVDRTREELAEERKQEAERDARARAAMLDQAGQPGGIDVDAAHLIPREVEALKQLRDEGKLDFRYVDPDTGETLDAWRQGARVIVTLKPEEKPKEERARGMAEFAGNDPNRCGLDSPFGAHRFKASTEVRVHHYDPLRMTCWRTPDDPIHNPATMCGSTSHDKPHPFEPKQGDDFHASGICGWPASAEIHTVPASEQADADTQGDDAAPDTADDTGPTPDGGGGSGGISSVNDMSAVLAEKHRRAVTDAQDASISEGRSKDDEVDTQRVLDWMGRAAISFHDGDADLVVALKSAEGEGTQACAGLKTATEAVVTVCKAAVDMAARHVAIATSGGAGEPYNAA